MRMLRCGRRLLLDKPLNGLVDMVGKKHCELIKHRLTQSDKSREKLCILRIGKTDSENTIALPKKQFKKGSLVVPPNQSHWPQLSPSETILAESLTKGKPLPSNEKAKKKKTDPQNSTSEQMKTTSANDNTKKSAIADWNRK